MPLVVQDDASALAAAQVAAALQSGAAQVQLAAGPAALNPVTDTLAVRLLQQLVNETRQLRRAVCLAANLPFLDGPDQPPYGA